VDNATKTLNNPFWDYSLSLYAKPGVEAQLLQWQNENHLDINLFLFSAWLLTQHRYLTTTQIPTLVEWTSDIIKPIRELRKTLKQIKLKSSTPALCIEPVRNLIKQAELLAEKNTQTWLYEHYKELSTAFPIDTPDFCALKTCYPQYQIDWLKEHSDIKL
jgi:uncharacterized protein (TIGR02444 family)